MDKINKKSVIEEIISKVPATSRNNNLLIVTYWKLVDGIDIPADIAKSLATRATSAETITRSKRYANKKFLRNMNKISVSEQ